MTMTEKLLPEDLKIQELEAQVEDLSAEVAGLEAEAESERARLQRFQAIYFERVGRLILFSDTLDAALAAEAARRSPADADLAAAAAEARARLDEAQKDAAATELSQAAEITPELKASFREAIRKVHPDLATDDADRAYRTEITQKLNEAYRKGDAAAVDAIMRDFQLAEMPDNAGKRLIILIRQEHDLRQRLVAIRKSVEELRQGDLARMDASLTDAEARGEDMFAQMTEELLSDIATKTRAAAAQGLVPTGFQRLG